MTVTAIIGALVLLGPAAADSNPPAPVLQAFAGMAHEQTCDFTRTQTHEGEVLIERFEENGGHPTWTLVSVDGEPPSTRRLKKYARDADRRAQRQHPARVDFGGLAEPDSYRLESVAAGQAVYGFQPLAESEDDEKVAPSLVGRLTIDQSTPRVLGFEVSNFEPFKPAVGVTVEEMKQTVDFEPVGPEGPIATRRIEVTMAGRAFGFKKIAEHRVITFDQFDCLQP